MKALTSGDFSIQPSFKTIQTPLAAAHNANRQTIVFPSIQENSPQQFQPRPPQASLINRCLQRSPRVTGLHYLSIVVPDHLRLTAPFYDTIYSENGGIPRLFDLQSLICRNSSTRRVQVEVPVILWSNQAEKLNMSWPPAHGTLDNSSIPGQVTYRVSLPLYMTEAQAAEIRQLIQQQPNLYFRIASLDGSILNI